MKFLLKRKYNFIFVNYFKILISVSRISSVHVGKGYWLFEVDLAIWMHDKNN